MTREALIKQLRLFRDQATYRAVAEMLDQAASMLETDAALIVEMEEQIRRLQAAWRYAAEEEKE